MNAVKLGCVGIAVGLAVAGCSSSNGSRLTMDDIVKADDKCPEYLWTAATQAGDYQASKGTASPLPDGPGSELARANGAGVQCTVDDGDLTVTLIAVRDGSAVALLMPRLGTIAQLNRSQLDGVARAAAATEPGRLVTFPGHESTAAALGIVKVPGARSAAFLMTGNGLVVDVATRFADNLH